MFIAGVRNYFFFRATKGRRQSKDRCLRAKWAPLYIGVDKGPNYGLRARLGPRAAIWEGLVYSISNTTNILLKKQKKKPHNKQKS